MLNDATAALYKAFRKDDKDSVAEVWRELCNILGTWYLFICNTCEVHLVCLLLQSLNVPRSVLTVT